PTTTVQSWRTCSRSIGTAFTLTKAVSSRYGVTWLPCAKGRAMTPATVIAARSMSVAVLFMSISCLVNGAAAAAPKLSRGQARPLRSVRGAATGLLELGIEPGQTTGNRRDAKRDARSGRPHRSTPRAWPRDAQRDRPHRVRPHRTAYPTTGYAPRDVPPAPRQSWDRACRKGTVPALGCGPDR